MYYYLYDSFLNDNKYQKQLHRIENRTVDLGINGKIGRVSMLISPEKLIQEEIKKGVTTIVAVGNDQTIDKIISIAAKEKITVGIIPVGKDNKIAKILGIPEGALACDILRQRRVKKIDLIKVNDRYCLSNLVMKIEKSKIICEDKYELELINKNGEIYIYNLGDKNEIEKIFDLNQDIKNYFNPNDGMLDLVIKSTKKSLVHNILKFVKKNTPQKINDISIVPIKKVRIESKDSASAICDNSTIIKTPLNIEVVPQALNIIVGKQREF